MKQIALTSILSALILPLSSTILASTAPQTPSPTPQPIAAPTPSSAIIIPPQPVLNAHGYVLMDSASGNIIAQKNMNAHMQPASLTKMMTLYIMSEYLASGRLKFSDLVPISAKANHVAGSRMFVKAGTKVPVEELMRGIIIVSANDACTAMAQYIGGNEATFVQMMNTTAKQLGMNDTHFVDSTGLPKPNHYSTPHDIAILAHALVTQFPQFYHFYSEKWLTYNGIRQPNTNRLLWRSKNFDGVKTGHTDEAGYCLAASGHEDGNRLISVVMGTPSDNARVDDSQALLNYGFRNFHTYELYKSMTPITKARVWYGMEKNVPVGLNQPLYVTVPTGAYKDLKATMSMKPDIQAPLAKGEALGQVSITLNGKPLASPSLVALDDDYNGGLWVSIRDHLSRMF